MKAQLERKLITQVAQAVKKAQALGQNQASLTLRPEACPGAELLPAIGLKAKVVLEAQW